MTDAALRDEAWRRLHAAARMQRITLAATARALRAARDETAQRADWFALARTRDDARKAQELAEHEAVEILARFDDTHLGWLDA